MSSGVLVHCYKNIKDMCHMPKHHPLSPYCSCTIYGILLPKTDKEGKIKDTPFCKVSDD